jgi:hypothetical protein
MIKNREEERRRRMNRKRSIFVPVRRLLAAEMVRLR